MRCLDLFCGAAGGWTLGLHRAGWTTVAACEVDPWRRAVFSHNWPEVVMFDDVRTLDAGLLAGLGPIDAIVGSPPCQDASTANAKGKGVDGERTGLFFDAVRLVREVRPRWVCFENVPGLRTRGYDRVHDALEAADYAVWPLVVGAWHAGAPHRRSRVWIIGRRNDAHSPTMLGPAFPRRQPDGIGAGVAADAAKIDAGSGTGPDGAGAPEPASDARHADGGPEGAQRGSRGGPGAEPKGTARHPDQARLPIRQTEPRMGEPKQREHRHSGLQAWGHWNGGAPDLGRVDDGLSARLAARRGIGRACLAAYGDAVVPAITEAIGRAILALDVGS